MATSTNHVAAGNKLGSLRANGAGTLHDERERKDDHGSGHNLGPLAVSAPSDGAGMEMATGQSGITWNPDHSIGMRLLLAQRAVKTLDKDVDVKSTTSKDGKTFGGFRGISADQVIAFAKDILTKNGILFTADLAADESPRKNGNKTEVKIVGRFENVDKPDDFRTRTAWGEGNDNSAHGYQKATTNAEKIIIGKMLMMTTVEDEQAPVETQTTTVSKDLREAKAENEATLRAWADNFKSALDACTTLKGLSDVRRDNASMLKSESVPEKTREYFQDKIAALEGTLQ